MKCLPIVFRVFYPVVLLVQRFSVIESRKISQPEVCERRQSTEDVKMVRFYFPPVCSGENMHVSVYIICLLWYTYSCKYVCTYMYTIGHPKSTLANCVCIFFFFICHVPLLKIFQPWCFSWASICFELLELLGAEDRISGFSSHVQDNLIFTC